MYYLFYFKIHKNKLGFQEKNFIVTFLVELGGVFVLPGPYISNDINKITQYVTIL